MYWLNPKMGLRQAFHINSAVVKPNSRLNRKLRTNYKQSFGLLSKMLC